MNMNEGKKPMTKENAIEYGTTDEIMDFMENIIFDCKETYKREVLTVVETLWRAWDLKAESLIETLETLEGRYEKQEEKDAFNYVKNQISKYVKGKKNDPVTKESATEARNENGRQLEFYDATEARNENDSQLEFYDATEATDAPQFLNRFEEYNEIIALEDALKYLRAKHKAGENVYINFGNVKLYSCREEFRLPFVVQELVGMPIEVVDKLDDSYVTAKTPEERMEIRKIWYTINGISYEHIEDMNREDAIEATDAPNEVYVGESWDFSVKMIDEVTELDNIVKYLKRCRHIGQNVYVNFYGHKLYSCDVTTRDAYLEVYGVTKEELINLASMLPSKSINTIFENIQKINNGLKGVNAQIQKLDDLAKYFWRNFKKIPATYMSSGKTENDNTSIEKNSDSEEISIAEAIEQAQNDAKFRVQEEKAFIPRLDELDIQQIILDVYSRFSERLTELTKEEIQEISGLQEEIRTEN